MWKFIRKWQKQNPATILKLLELRPYKIKNIATKVEILKVKGTLSQDLTGRKERDMLLTQNKV